MAADLRPRAGRRHLTGPFHLAPPPTGGRRVWECGSSHGRAISRDSSAGGRSRESDSQAAWENASRTGSVHPSSAQPAQTGRPAVSGAAFSLFGAPFVPGLVSGAGVGRPRSANQRTARVHRAGASGARCRGRSQRGGRYQIHLWVVLGRAVTREIDQTIKTKSAAARGGRRRSRVSGCHVHSAGAGVEEVAGRSSHGHGPAQPQLLQVRSRQLPAAVTHTRVQKGQ